MPEPARRQVLITRPEPDAAETARLVARLGWEPVIAPLLRIEPGMVEADGAFDAVLVTSRNAIAALPPRHRATRLLAVGAATAARAREAGWSDVLHADGDAAALAGLVRQTCAPGVRLLLAHGRGQGESLAAALRGSGFCVEARCAYASIPVDMFPAAAAAALQGGRVRAALFLSAETAACFARLLPDQLRAALGGVEAMTIGKAAADELTPLPWRRVRVSVRPTLDHVLALL